MGATNTTVRKGVYKNLISTKELANEIFETGVTSQQFKLKKDVMKKVKIIDATAAGKAKEAFREKSIPSATLLDVQNELKDPKGRFANTFPTADIVKGLMENMGVNKNDHIVLYGQVGAVAGTTRTYSVLASYGFPNIYVLDGGLKKYIADNLPTVPGEDFKGEKSVITDLVLNKQRIADFAFIKEFAQGKHSDYQLIDVRPPADFNATENSGIPECKAGHVEGAINIPMGQFYHSDSLCFKSPEELAELFKKHKVDRNKKTIAMCRSGMTATVAQFVFEQLEFKHVQLYDGSWTEYGTLDQKSA